MQEAARLKDQQVLEAQQANAALLARCEGAELNFRRHVEAMRSVEAAQAGAAAVGRASQGIRSSEDANCFDGSLSHCDATFRGACSLSLPRPCDDDSASEASGYHKGSAAPSSSSWSPCLLASQDERPRGVDDSGVSRTRSAASGKWWGSGSIGHGSGVDPSLSGKGQQHSRAAAVGREGSRCGGDGHARQDGKDCIGLIADFDSLRCAHIADYIGARVPTRSQGSEAASAV